MYGFKAFTFDGKKSASKALDTLEDYTPAYVWIDDVALLSKSKHGRIRVHSTWAQDDSDVGAGAGLGAMTGALIGLLFGPAGALAGAMGGGSLRALLGASAPSTGYVPQTLRGKTIVGRAIGVESSLGSQ